MKFQYTTYLYQLKAPHPVVVGASSTKEGALLRVEFENHQIGYADCHPWVSLCDLELSDQLKMLSKNQLTPLTERSIQIAWLDAQARERKISLFENLKIPRSHWLVTNLAQWKQKDIADAVVEGFDRFKLKLGKDLKNEIKEVRKLITMLPASHKVRLILMQRLQLLNLQIF